MDHGRRTFCHVPISLPTSTQRTVQHLSYRQTRRVWPCRIRASQCTITTTNTLQTVATLAQQSQPTSRNLWAPTVSCHSNFTSSNTTKFTTTTTNILTLIKPLATTTPPVTLITRMRGRQRWLLHLKKCFITIITSCLCTITERWREMSLTSPLARGAWSLSCRTERQRRGGTPLRL